MHTFKLWLRRFVGWVGVLSLMLTGCVKATPTPEAAELTFSFMEQDRAYIQRLAEQFEQQNPQITIKLKPHQPFRQGETSDVNVVQWEVMLQSGEANMPFALDLNTFLEQDTTFNPNDYYPGTLDAFRLEGKLKAIPYGIDPYLLYYNKDLFNSAQVAVPQPGWTWDDFLAKAQALSNPDSGMWGYLANNNFEDSIFFTYQNEGKLVDGSGRPALNDARTVEAVEWYGRLFNQYMFAPSPQRLTEQFSTNRGANQMAIVSSKAAMWIAPFSERGGDTTVPWNFAWGAVPLPSGRSSFTAAFFEGYAISTRTQHPDAAWAWMSFLMRQPSSRLVPARRSLAESAAFTDTIGSEVAGAAKASAGSAVLINRDLSRSMNALMQPFLSAVVSVVNGEATAQEALDAAQQAAGGAAQ